MEPTVCFVSASHQNVFFAELSDALAEALGGLGITVEHSVDRFPQPREGLVYVFVAHELLPFLLPQGHPNEHQLKRSVTICTEQPGTRWFEQSAHICERTAAAIDINRLGVAALGKLGIHARFLQLGYVPRWDRWGGELSAERPVDLAFLGGLTPRRLAALARCGRYLAGHHTELRLTETVFPHQAGSELFLSGARKWDLLSRSKVLMNVHRGELAYFEWQRSIEAMINGCVLLSEHSLGFEPLVAGEHFASVSFDSLEVALEGLLEDEERLDAMRAGAYALLREEYPLSSSIEILAEAVSEVASQPLPVAARGGRLVPPLPKPPRMPPTAYERVLGEGIESVAVCAARKPVTFDRGEVRQALNDRPAVVSDRYRAEGLLESSGPPKTASPRVSVLIATVADASSLDAVIESVALSEFADYELIVVDALSSADSGDAIRAALSKAPWVSSTYVTPCQCHGIADARNLGVRVARGDLLCVLDTEHAIYPHALGRLVEAMDGLPHVVFVYGIVERLDAEGNGSLSGFLEWDPGRLRYGKFIDAVAMVRRSALVEVGGYLADPGLHGWEDFALWCELAHRGWGGVRVAEILARQLASHARTPAAEVDAATAWKLLLDRFAFLAARSDA
jgi:hypothetical protein